MAKKVFVSGCYDMLHSGHVAFFKDAARYGDLYVGIGSDETLATLKGHQPINSDRERLYMVKSIRYVHDAWINHGSGMLDFEKDLRKKASCAETKMDVFVVNSDGDKVGKRELCKELGMEYVVLERIPDEGLPAHSTTAIRKADPCQLPSRLDIAGTWIDQPYVSKYAPGWAITVSLEQPVDRYRERCGMSTSTIKAARKIWPYRLPEGDPVMIAKTLFCFENFPGKTTEIAGAQDSIGICVPGLCRHYYDNDYWPKEIERCNDDAILDWLESHICMIPMKPRPIGFSVIDGCDITTEKVVSLTEAADWCWDAIMRMELNDFARYFKVSFDAQTSMFPQMLANGVKDYIEKYKNKALAWKMPGAGGGGYLVLVVEKPIDGSMPIKIRRKDWQ